MTRAESGTGNVVSKRGQRGKQGWWRGNDRAVLGDHSKDFAIHFEWHK